MKHSDKVEVLDEGGVPVLHTPELIRDLFDEELDVCCGRARRAMTPK